MSSEGQGHFLTLAQGCVHTKIQTGFSQKLCTVPIWTNFFIITETSPYWLGNFRKFILNIVFELNSKYLQKMFYLIYNIYLEEQYLVKVAFGDFWIT